MHWYFLNLKCQLFVWHKDFTANVAAVALWFHFKENTTWCYVSVRGYFSSSSISAFIMVCIAFIVMKTNSQDLFEHILNTHSWFPSCMISSNYQKIEKFQESLNSQTSMLGNMLINWSCFFRKCSSIFI